MESTFYADLLGQMKEKEFGPLRFTIYNYIENEGYLAELSGHNGRRYDIDDLEYMVFDVPDEDKNAMRSENGDVIFRYNSFAHHVSGLCGGFSECGIFVMWELGIVFAVKPKGFDVKKIGES